MELYVVRHGETDGNVNRIMDGQRDIPINENGEMQAHVAKEQLKDIKFDIIICSPLIRTRQTMGIINIHNYPVIYEKRILERDCGEFMGKSFDSLDRDLYWNYLDETKYEKAENIKDFFKRIFDYVDDIKKEYANKRVLIVTHGGVSKAIHCYFNGIPEDGCLRHIGLGNCEVAKYSL
jgi:broad specificity phosphatase PhoE